MVTTMLHYNRSKHPNSFQEACVTSVQKALSCSPSGSRDKRWTAQAKSHKDVPKVSADQAAFASRSHEKQSIEALRSIAALSRFRPEPLVVAAGLPRGPLRDEALAAGCSGGSPRAALEKH